MLWGNVSQLFCQALLMLVLRRGMVMGTAWTLARALGKTRLPPQSGRALTPSGIPEEQERGALAKMQLHPHPSQMHLLLKHRNKSFWSKLSVYEKDLARSLSSCLSGVT